MKMTELFLGELDREAAITRRTLERGARRARGLEAAPEVDGIRLSSQSRGRTAVVDRHDRE
jgi:hypothetical protein